MLFKNDLELIESFHIKSGHSANSIKSYNTVFNNYRSYHDLSLCELLDEAIREQENNVPENRLRIYDRILDFRNFLIENYTGKVYGKYTLFLYNGKMYVFHPAVVRCCYCMPAICLICST